MLSREVFTSSNGTVHSNKEKFNYPSSLIAQVDLLNIINKHNVDLNIYNDIVKWLKFHSIKREINWPDAKWLRRKQLLGQLGKYADTSKLKPVVIDIPLPLKHIFASVPVFNFSEMALSLFHDKTLIGEKNLIKDFDIKTGKTTTNVHSDKFGAYHTGNLYESC